MKGSIWIYHKRKDNIEYRFQVDGIKRGAYTKVLDPIFKQWHNVAEGYNHKTSTETMIYSGSFPDEEQMIEWVKKTIEFPTIYNKCNARCTEKVLVENKDEVVDVVKKTTRSGTVRKSKSTSSS